MIDEETWASDAPLGRPFSLRLFARWPDMDFNQHMRNAAYLGASEDTRMKFLVDRGFSMETFRTKNIGPVVVEDRITYKKELKLLEEFRVDLELAAITKDGRRMKVRNTFRRQENDALVAVVESVVLWLDLAKRQPTAPPEELHRAWLELARTSDFEWLEERSRG